MLLLVVEDDAVLALRLRGHHRRLGACSELARVHRVLGAERETDGDGDASDRRKSTSASRSTSRSATRVASTASQRAHDHARTPRRRAGRRRRRAGRAARSASASKRSSSSPTPWPCTSLTRLKSSMSSMSTATGVCVRLASCSACSSRSWKTLWLKRPVSESVRAWCSSRARICGVVERERGGVAEALRELELVVAERAVLADAVDVEHALDLRRARSAGCEISASGSIGVPGTKRTRGSRCAWLTSAASRLRAAQPVMPSSKRTRRPQDLLGVLVAGEHGHEHGLRLVRLVDRQRVVRDQLARACRRCARAARRGSARRAPRGRRRRAGGTTRRASSARRARPTASSGSRRRLGRASLPREPRGWVMIGAAVEPPREIETDI